MSDGLVHSFFLIDTGFHGFMEAYHTKDHLRGQAVPLACTQMRYRFAELRGLATLRLSPLCCGRGVEVHRGEVVSTVTRL